MSTRFPGESTKGTTWYAISRAMQMKFMRMPKAQVKIGQQLPEVGWFEQRPDREAGTGRQEPIGGAQSRQQRGRRGHHDARGASGETVESPPPGGGDVEVRREPAIRIDLV